MQLRRCLLPWLAVLAASPGLAAPLYAYEARLAQRALTGGSFSLGSQPWSCMGTLLACQGLLAQPLPRVADCQALAARVGAVASFARVGGAALRPEELVACNRQARAQPPAAPARPRP